MRRAPGEERATITQRSRGQAVHALIDEVERLRHPLRVAGEAFHGVGALSRPRQRLLRDLREFGPQTVPQLARLRTVSRQTVQTTVNSLQAEGLAELTANPAHKRSRLVRLTAAGEAAIDGMTQHEETLLAQVLPEIPEAEIRAAVSVLRALRELLNSGEWKEMLDNGDPGRS
jgi:DNA-binding MarR family transcriptional regulator